MCGLSGDVVFDMSCDMCHVLWAYSPGLGDDVDTQGAKHVDSHSDYFTGIVHLYTEKIRLALQIQSWHCLFRPLLGLFSRVHGTKLFSSSSSRRH